MPRPSDLIAVPSCAPCNHGAPDSDERFRAYLSLHVGVDSQSTTRLWSEALKGVRHNRRLHQHLLNEMEPVWLTTSQGSSTAKQSKVAGTLTHMTKPLRGWSGGLYFHHYKQVLGSRVTIKTHWLLTLDPELVEVTADCEQRSVGGGQFVYRFGRAINHPLHSTWFFEFHKRHWAGGQTAPAQP